MSTSQGSYHAGVLECGLAFSLRERSLDRHGVVSVHSHAEDWCVHASCERKLGDEQECIHACRRKRQLLGVSLCASKRGDDMHACHACGLVKE